jgi:outer membrane protein OmpA-like peptidoglycan-associated protein
MAAWDRESRYGDVDREEEQLRKGRVTPGKRSLTHSAGSSFGDLPAPGKVPATLSVTDERAGVAPDPGVRARVEATTGADLSGARIHTGADSQESAAALRAKAFTVGQDIHFAAGQYQPGTAAGGHLLAHELVHTVQQGGGAPTAQLKSSEVSQEGDAAEVEADRIAGAAMSGGAARMTPVARAAPIARTPESLTGNPAERTDSTGAAITSHRSSGVGDAANAPAVGTAGTEARTTNVKPKATETAPYHVNGAVCPIDSVIYEEDSAATPPAGFTSVTGFSGTTAAPMITQEAAPSIYINATPTAEDVQQGGIGDCYFMAALVSIVGRDPGKITGMTVADGRGGATITFWRAQPRSAGIIDRVLGRNPGRDWIQVAVTVTDDLAVNIANNRVHGAQVRCAPNPKSQDWWATVVAPNLEIHRKDTFELARWAPLMEKAYARFAQTHGQYGGADPRGQSGGSGYNDINSGFGLEVFFPFYGPMMDDPNNRPGWAVTSYTPGAPGNSIVAANATVMEHLILLQGRGTGAAAGDTNAPIITALTSVDAMIGRLQTTIPVAAGDPDWVNVDAARQGLVTAITPTIAAWQILPPDPTPVAPTAPKATAKRAIGTACGAAIHPGVDDSANQTYNVNNLFRGWATPIQFPQGGDALPPDKVNAMNSLNQNLRARTNPQVAIEIHGHSSAEGTDADNMALSQRRVDNVETALLARGAIAPHTETKTAHGEAGATVDPSWRKVEFVITPTGARVNTLLDPARSQNIRDLAGLLLDLRNIGTDSSPGQRNVYGDHAYAVIAVNIVTTTGVNVPLNTVPAANRAALYPLVDPDVSTVTLRNPHHGNEPDRTDSNRPARAGDGDPSGAGSDGVFNVTLRDFFRDFNSINSGVFPRS